jgi:hypothetical protein
LSGLHGFRQITAQAALWFRWGRIMTTFIWTGVALWLGLNAAVAAFACTLLSRTPITNETCPLDAEYASHSDFRGLQ